MIYFIMCLIFFSSRTKNGIDEIFNELAKFNSSFISKSLDENQSENQNTSFSRVNTDECKYEVLKIQILEAIYNNKVYRLPRSLSICKIHVQTIDLAEFKNLIKIYLSMDKIFWKTVNLNEMSIEGNFIPREIFKAHYLKVNVTGFERFLPKKNSQLIFYTFFNDDSIKIVQRSKIQHPIDGRIIHYDMEDFDENHENPIIMDRGLLANDAMLKGSGARILDLHGSCRHVIKLGGNNDRLEFYSNNIIFRPKLKISILIWIQPTDFNSKYESSSLVIITGMHPDPYNSYVRMDRYANGSIGCRHKNEKGDLVFDIISDENEVPLNQWTHVAFTYAVDIELKGEARLYLNGTLKYRSRGEGYISKDWDGFAALGSDNTGNFYIGYMDDFMLFDRVLIPNEINSIYEKCHFDKYYTGENIKTDHGVIVSPGYPSLHLDPISAHWVLRAEGNQFIEIFIEVLKIGRNESCDRSNLIVRNLMSGFLIERICGGLHENKTILTNSSAVILDFESSGETEGIKYRIRFSQKPNEQNKRNIIFGGSCLENAKTFSDLLNLESDQIVANGVYQTEKECFSGSCLKYNISDVFYEKGLCFSKLKKYQKFPSKEKRISPYKSEIIYPNNFCAFHNPLQNIVFLKYSNIMYIPDVIGDSECKETCCNSISDPCHGVIIYKGSCFHVNCGNTLCDFRPAFIEVDNLSIYFRMENLKLNEDLPRKACEKSIFPDIKPMINYVNLDALENNYNFTFLGSFDIENDCLDICCTENYRCQLALLFKNACFSLSCKKPDGCNIIGESVLEVSSLNLKLYPSNFYFEKMKSENNKVTCRISKIIFNEIFLHGLSSGNFINMGKIYGNNDCPQLVCNFNKNASLAFQIGQHCFAVICHNLESCATINIEEKKESTTSIPTIIWYFNTSKTDNITRVKSKLELITQNLKRCYAGSSFQGLALFKLNENQRYTSLKFQSMEQCVASCCDSDFCDLVYLNGSTCYNIQCQNLNDCAVKFEDNQQPLQSMTYMVRYSNKDINELDIMKQCQNYSSTIIENASFTSVPVSTLRFLGLIKNIDECGAKCCRRYYCDTVYIVGYSCYGLICGENLEMCNYTIHLDNHLPTYIIYNLKIEERTRKIYFVLEYTIIIVLIITASLIGIAITVKMCIQRSRAKMLYKSYGDPGDN